MLAIAALEELTRIDAAGRERAAAANDRHSPWHASDGWRLNEDNHHALVLRDGDREHTVTAHYRDDHYELELPGGRLRASAEPQDDGLRVDLGGLRLSASVIRRGTLLTVLTPEGSHSLELHDPLAAGMEDEVADGSLTAPMPGQVTGVLVKAGDRVAAGDPLIVLEAMKMEYTITAPQAAVVDTVNYAVGDQVEEGTELLALTIEEEE